MSDPNADLPSIASLAFDGIIPESFPSITETDVLDAQVETDLAERDWWTHGDEEPDFDPDLGRESGPLSQHGKDFGDEDAIFGKGL